MQEKGLIIIGPSEQQSGAQELHVDWTSEQGRPKTNPDNDDDDDERG